MDELIYDAKIRGIAAGTVKVIRFSISIRLEKPEDEHEADIIAT